MLTLEVYFISFAIKSKEIQMLCLSTLQFQYLRQISASWLLSLFRTKWKAAGRAVMGMLSFQESLLLITSLLSLCFMLKTA